MHRAGPDERHLAAQDVPQLGQLVEARLRSSAPDPGDAVVDDELVEAALAALVAVAVDQRAHVVAMRRRCRRPSCIVRNLSTVNGLHVAPEPALAEEHRAGRVEPDRRARSRSPPARGEQQHERSRPAMSRPRRAARTARVSALSVEPSSSTGVAVAGPGLDLRCSRRTPRRWPGFHAARRTGRCRSGRERADGVARRPRAWRRSSPATCGSVQILLGEAPRRPAGCPARARGGRTPPCGGSGSGSARPTTRRGRSGARAAASRSRGAHDEQVVDVVAVGADEAGELDARCPRGRRAAARRAGGG